MMFDIFFLIQIILLLEYVFVMFLNMSFGLLGCCFICCYELGWFYVKMLVYVVVENLIGFLRIWLMWQ